jgi:hypothetical protein
MNEWDVNTKECKLPERLMKRRARSRAGRWVLYDQLALALTIRGPRETLVLGRETEQRRF